MRPSRLVTVLFCLLCISKNALAITDAMFESMRQDLAVLNKTVGDLTAVVQQQNTVIADYGMKIESLEKGQVIRGQDQLSPQSTGSMAPSLAGLTQRLNPDIGVVGTVQAHFTEDNTDGEGRDTVALKELELNFAQYVDPYSRLDAIIAFNDAIEEQNVEIEEAYYTRWGLPLGFTGQIGKFRSKIGKQNLLHTHALDTVDYPLVIQEYFGEEGLSSSGVRLQNMIPNPFDIPVEVTGEVLRGNNGTSFSGVSRRPIFKTHVKSFFETGEDSNLELGWTTLFGDENPAIFESVDDGSGTGTFVDSPVTRPNGQDRYGVQVFGADLTWNWFINQVRALKFQNEVYFQNRAMNPHINHNPWGFYSLLDLRLNKQFSVGTRFDFVELLDIVTEHERTAAVSTYLTFWQSEFASFRVQYTHTEPAAAERLSDDAVFLQANFLIGDHKHPVQ